MSELRKRMIRDMQLLNFSPGTQRGHLRAAAGLAQYYHRSPDTIGSEEIQDYIVHLLSERKLAVGSCHSIITGLRFFYTVTLKQDGASPQVKKVTRLPEILSPEQLELLFTSQTIYHPTSAGNCKMSIFFDKSKSPKCLHRCQI